MSRPEDELRGATVSMNRWRNGVDDDGPSGAARANHLHQCCENAAHEIDRLRESLEEIASHHVTQDPLWWQQRARDTLAETPD